MSDIENRVAALEEILSYADDKADRALGSAQQMHNLLLQLQQRVRALSLRADLDRAPIDKPKAIGAPPIEGGVETVSTRLSPDDIAAYWKGRFAALRGEFEQQLQELRAERDMALGEVASLKEERHILQGKLEAAEKQARILYHAASGDSSQLQPGDVEPLTDAQRRVIVGGNIDAE